MGDRAQIAIKTDKNGSVFLYSHWDGAEIFPKLKKSLLRGDERHNDPEYLARIIFDDLVNGSKGTSGYGISTSRHTDIEHLIPVVDCDTQEISFLPADFGEKNPPEPMSFDDFMKLEEFPDNW